MTKAEQALQTVQQLYILQTELFRFLESDESKPETLLTAKKQAREFQSLLRSADWRYMGGEDVYEELQKLPKEVSVKLKTSKVKGQKKR